MRRLLALAALLATACGGVAARPTNPQAVAGDISVFAAASLTTAFQDLARSFEAGHPAARVRYNFGGSTTLATQVNQGAPADVFASADQPNMRKVVDAGNAAGAPQVFARNQLQIVVAAGNPRHITSLAGLAAPGVVVVLCAPAVPCGNYAGQALTKAGVAVTPKSQEQDVSAVVSKVALGEADAGIVYTTDVRSAGPKVQGVDIPDADNVVATYPVVAVRGAPNAAGARAFISFLTGARGQDILARHGFAKP